MTCIVGVTNGERVWIGGDSQGSSGSTQVYRADTKVFRRGELLIGYTSSFRMGQLLRYELDPPKPKGDPHRWMVKSFIPEVRKLFTDHGYTKADNGRIEGGNFLVGFGANLFDVESDFQVGVDQGGYSACGSGQRVAYGSLHTTAVLDLEPKRRVLLALEAATAHDTYVGGDYKVLRTREAR